MLYQTYTKKNKMEQDTRLHRSIFTIDWKNMFIDPFSMHYTII